MRYLIVLGIGFYIVLIVAICSFAPILLIPFFILSAVGVIIATYKHFCKVVAERNAHLPSEKAK